MDINQLFNIEDLTETVLEKQNEIIVAVDCENSDVFKLASVLTQLKEQNLRKIKKIVLFDDVNTTPVWKYLQTITGIPVEYVLVERIKQDKSLVDMKICAEITKERYKNNINSFILVSSDSDYWGLISSLHLRTSTMVLKAWDFFTSRRAYVPPA